MTFNQLNEELARLYKAAQDIPAPQTAEIEDMLVELVEAIGHAEATAHALWESVEANND